MRKIFLFMLGSFLLFSCTDVIDKKISKETAIKDIPEIRKKYANEYVEKDYEALAGHMLSQFLLNKKASDKTYREVLDESKAKRVAATEQYKKDLQAYEAGMKDTEGRIKVEVVGREVEKLYSLEKLKINVKSTNISKADISAFRAVLEVRDAFDRITDRVRIESTEDLAAGESIENWYSVGGLIKGDVSKFNFIPTIEEIILKDGTKITVPDKPMNPDAE